MYIYMYIYIHTHTYKLLKNIKGTPFFCFVLFHLTTNLFDDCPIIT